LSMMEPAPKDAKLIIVTCINVCEALLDVIDTMV